MPGLDLETIRHALGVAQNQGFAEVQLESDGQSFFAILDRRPIRPAPTMGAPEPNSRIDLKGEEASERAIAASFVGYYRPASVPLEIGRRVEKGEIVASIAALGLGHDVESPVSGEVVQVLVEPDQAVEYGQALAMVREA